MTETSSKISASSTGSIPRMRFPMHLKRRKKYRLRRRGYTFQAEPDRCGSSADAIRIANLERDLAEAQQKLEEAEARIIRGLSDIENLRRRFQREKDELRKYATEDLMRSLVPAMDHFGLAIKSLDAASDTESVRQGVIMIHRELESVLEQSGLSIIEPGEVAFDPNLHEAVGTDADPSKPDGVILELMRPGWSLNGRVLRPALVRVNKVQPTEVTEETAAE
jgi:molecular chaperone GrpE